MYPTALLSHRSLDQWLPLLRGIEAPLPTPDDELDEPHAPLRLSAAGGSKLLEHGIEAYRAGVTPTGSQSASITPFPDPTQPPSDSSPSSDSALLPPLDRLLRSMYPDGVWSSDAAGCTSLTLPDGSRVLPVYIAAAGAGASEAARWMRQWSLPPSDEQSGAAPVDSPSPLLPPLFARLGCSSRSPDACESGFFLHDSDELLQLLEKLIEFARQ